MSPGCGRLLSLLNETHQLYQPIIQFTLGSKAYILIDPLTLRKIVAVISECALSVKHGACVFLHSAQPRREVKEESFQATFPSACCDPGVRVRWAVLLAGSAMLLGH